MPDFYTKGMAATVRAVALAALVDHGKVNLSDLQRYRPHVPQMSLFGKAHFLLAALGVTGSDAMRADVCNRILAHADQSGGKFVFSEEIDDSYTRILASALRTNGAVLSALAAYARTEPGKQLGRRYSGLNSCAYHPEPQKSRSLGKHPGKHVLHECPDRLQPRVRK